MLSDKDIKAVVGPTPRMYMFLKCTVAFLILFFGFGAVYNLYLAFHYASLFGLDVFGAIELWNQETVLRKTYAGYELASLHRLNMSILSFGMVILLSLQLGWFITTRKRNSRILSALVQAGAVSGERVNA
ncbi:hypothetical protein [Marinobacter sp. SS21]|uniref:hypothetical protein n=1 Tax=Marinobacter sp. SS21 TaxID=2979460 RepID=UPI00232E114B|nr:hypothetical protein [Marinobacter sp. SS21]MDC0660925.1 hypothetical protein [Marinobacter sp. SS21]